MHFKDERGDEPKFSTCVIAVGGSIYKHVDHLRYLEGYVGCSWLALDHIPMMGRGNKPKKSTGTVPSMGDDGAVTAEGGLEANPHEAEFWKYFTKNVAYRMFPIVTGLRMELHASSYEFESVHGWSCPPNVKLDASDGEFARLTSLFHQEAIETREKKVRTKGNVVLLKVKKKNAGHVNNSLNAMADEKFALQEHVRIAWRYESGMVTHPQVFLQPQ